MRYPYHAETVETWVHRDGRLVVMWMGVEIVFHPIYLPGTALPNNEKPEETLLFIPDDQIKAAGDHMASLPDWLQEAYDQTLEVFFQHEGQLGIVLSYPIDPRKLHI